MKGSNRTRSKGKSKRKILKSYLKQITANENMTKLFPFAIVVFDLLDDGQINGTIITGILS